MTAPRFFFSRIQESFQNPTGGPASRSLFRLVYLDRPEEIRRQVAVSGFHALLLSSSAVVPSTVSPRDDNRRPPSGYADARVYDPVRDVLHQEGDMKKNEKNTVVPRIIA